jgi:serine/threonine protein kinase
MPFNIKNKRYFYSLMLQLVDHVQTLHSLNYVHADLKLQNMCFGLNNKN